MTVLETVFGAIVISVVSAVIGKEIGDRGKVTITLCSEHQRACQQLLLEKLANLEKQIQVLTNIVNDKILGL
jgi:hypothetical protein